MESSLLSTSLSFRMILRLLILFGLAPLSLSAQSAEVGEKIGIECNKSKLFQSSALTCLYSFHGGPTQEKATQDQYFSYGTLPNGDMVSFILLLPREQYNMNAYSVESSKEYLRLFNDWTKSGSNWDQYKGFKSTGYISFNYKDNFCIAVDHAGPPKHQGYSYILRGAYCQKSPIANHGAFVKELLNNIRISESGTNKTALGEEWKEKSIELSSKPTETNPSLANPALENRSPRTSCSSGFSFSKPPAQTQFPPDNYVKSMVVFHSQDEMYDYGELAACVCMAEAKFSSFSADQVATIFREMASHYLKSTLLNDSKVVKDTTTSVFGRTSVEQEIQTRNAKGENYTILLTLIKTNKTGQCYAMLFSGFEPKNSYVRKDAENFIAENKNIP